MDKSSKPHATQVWCLKVRNTFDVTHKTHVRYQWVDCAPGRVFFFGYPWHISFFGYRWCTLVSKILQKILKLYAFLCFVKHSSDMMCLPTAGGQKGQGEVAASQNFQNTNFYIYFCKVLNYSSCKFWITTCFDRINDVYKKLKVSSSF